MWYEFDFQIYEYSSSSEYAQSDYTQQYYSYVHGNNLEDILSCIKHVINERKIIVKYFHDEKEDNKRISIQFNDFEFDHMILKKIGDIYVHFRCCKIDIIEFTDNQHGFCFRDQFCFSGTEVQVLDYSKTSLDTFDLFLQLNSVDANLLILPEQLKGINIRCGIKNIQLSSYDYLESLELEYQPLIDCGRDKGDDKILNLQKFSKLVRIKLANIEKDILLPNKLESLYLERGSQSKILNSRLSSQYIKIHNFDLQQIQVLEYNQLHLYYCTIQNLFLHPKQDLQYIRDNKIENLIIDSEYDVIVLKENEIKNIVFRNYYIQKLSLKGFININVDCSLEDNNHNVIQQENQIAKTNCFDFTQFNKLKELSLETCMYFSLLDQYLQLPIQLQSISLTSTYHFQPQENTIFDFSQFINLSNVQITRFIIKSVIMYNNRLKFDFKLDSKYYNTFQIKSLQTVHENSCLFSNFVNNISVLQVSGLQNLVIEDKPVNQLDFQIFQNLQILQLWNIENQIQLPNSIEEFYLENYEKSEFQFNFDLSLLKMLKSIKLNKCKINNLITQPCVVCRFHLCTIDFLSIPFLKGEGQYSRQFVYESTVIKTFQQQKQQEIIAIDPSYQSRQFSGSVQTLIINEPKILQKLSICSMKQMIVNDHNNNGILDFTAFTSLIEVRLINLQCAGIIFGYIQEEICLYSLKRNYKIEFMDFRNCQQAESAKQLKYEIQNQLVGTLYLGNHIISHTNCKFDCVQFCQNSGHVNTPILQDYNETTKYAVQFVNGTKQRVLYKIDFGCFDEQSTQFYISKSVLLVHKLNHLYNMINQVLNE